MSAVVGIDLGTTNTVVAHVQGGRGRALPDENGRTLLPSVVSFHPNGEVLVGWPAKERRLVDARNTVFSTKRLIGRGWDSAEVQKSRERFPFELREGPGQGALVVARGETYTLPEISAYVLRKAKAVAEAAIGERVDRAVVTVPANFNDLQRAATKVAGRVAGIEVLRIINEPTAAALAYGYGRSAAERVAIYDLGGGTCDVTLLDLSSNVFEVLSTAGDMFLGGDDIDDAIADRICETFLRTHRFDPRTDPQAFERIRAAAESIKVALSTQTQAQVEIKDVGFGAGGRPLSMPYSMSRVELNVLLEPLLDRTFAVCDDALRTAKLSPSDFQQVILVGGSSRIPLVRERVGKFFGHEPQMRISPDQVVAIGAAIQAMALTSHERKPNPQDTRRVATAGGLGESAQEAQLRAGRTEKTNPGVGESGGPKTNPGVGRPETARGMAPPPPRRQPINVPPARAPLPSVPASVEPQTPLYRAPVDGLEFEEFAPDPPKPAAPPPPKLPPLRPGRALDKATLVSASAEAKRALEGPQELSLDDSGQFTFADENTSLHDTRELSAALGRSAPDDELRAIADSVRDSRPPRLTPLPPISSPPPRGPMTTPMGAAAGFVAPPPPAVPTADFGTPHRPMLSTQLLSGGPPAAPVPPPVPTGMKTQVLAAVQMPPPQPVITQMTYEPAPPQQPQPQAFAPAPYAMPEAPLLIDVTPLSLSVETVGGYCDVVIDRNTPVPCERERMFATVQTNQTTVKVRVAQGEAQKFAQNTVLGEVELSGLRNAPRGELQIAVVFQMDVNGMLQVRARDVSTGQEAQVAIRLVTGQGDAAAMRARQDAQHVV
jgi:molecular chaperone DnaK